ncbi:MAG: Do family serine endopeptidase [Spirochaetia bacterium]
MKRKIYSLATVLAVVAAGSALFLLAPVSGFAQVKSTTTEQSGHVSAAPRSVALTSSLASLQDSFRAVAQKVLPSIVEIDVTQTVTQQVPQFNFPFDFGFPFDQGQGNGGGGSRSRTFRQSGLGSGIIVQHTGSRYYVLTNNHVVKDASDISVKLNDQRVFKARTVGTDPRKDVALVSFDTRDSIPVAEMGDSNTVQVGDIVFAIGNPFGYESTVTMGIVSALGRHGPQGDVASYTDYIQTDAPINQGNSGGALVNIDGQVIGMNTWIAAPTGGNIGLGFAIPIDNARQPVQDFIGKGKVEYGWLGAQIADVQDSDTYPGLASDLKLEGMKGAFVVETYKGSPADRSGVLPGDYVTSVDNTQIANAASLTQVVGGLSAGRTYTFSVVRYGEKTSVPVKIGVRDDQDQVAQAKNLWPGMTVIDINDQVRQQVSIPRGTVGVVVGYVPDESSPASIAGLRPGDVITAINGQSVRNMMDYYKALNVSAKGSAMFTIQRDGTEIKIGLDR